MSKPSPFNYVKSINEKNYCHELTGYNPYLTNRCFAEHIDTILMAEEMNQAHNLAPDLQYEFYYYAVRRGRRFGFPPKPPEVEHLELIQRHYGYSREKAIQALKLLTFDQIQSILRSKDTGGR